MSISPAEPSPKVFVIGANKTGTTSLGEFLDRVGYRVGDQYTAEKLMYQWAERNWKPILDYCHSADAFQDIPFSLDWTYAILDAHFPNSKFILSHRDSARTWMNSYVNHLKRTIGSDVISYDTLYAFSRNHPKGWMVYCIENIFGWDSRKPLDEDYLMAWYERRNDEIRRYFGNRPNDFLALNIDANDCDKRLAAFLGLTGEERLKKLNADPMT